MSNEQMRIGDLAAATGVSARTVRYYIVEGLLPPPEGAGLGAMYGPAHLDRLRLILRLKGAYLPLREIRRQLTGLDDAGVRRRLKEMETAAARARTRTAPSTGQEDSMPTRERADSAADYLQRIARTGGQTTPLADSTSRLEITALSPAEPATLDDDREPWSSPPPHGPNDPDAPVYPGYLPPGSPLTIGRAVPAVGPPDPPVQQDDPAATSAAAENWVRLRIGDDVELLVRSGAYHRLRDRVDWLTGWARAIFR